MYYGYKISDYTADLARRAEADCKEIFAKIEENALICSAKVLSAFQECKVSTADFIEVTGYGFTDSGRDKLEEIYAKVFGAEDVITTAEAAVMVANGLDLQETFAGSYEEPLTRGMAAKVLYRTSQKLEEQKMDTIV